MFFYKVVDFYIDNFKTMWYNRFVMDITYENGNVILKKVSDFNLTHIFDCGQCFRFNKVCDGTYEGVAFGKALRISQTGDEVTLYGTTSEDFLDVWYDFFDLSQDYGMIKKTL